MNQNLQIASVPAIPLEDVKLTKEGDEMILAALEGSALVCKVDNEVENSIAENAVISLKKVVNLLESTRVEHTKPALDFQRKLKAFFDGKAEDLKKEIMRVTKLAGDYASLQLAKARAEENARNAELSRLEREREQSLAKAPTHEAREQIQEHYNQRAEIEASAPTVAIPKSASPDIEIIVTDIYALAKAYPNCVNPPTLRMTETKALLKAGISLPGVTVKEVVKVNFRAGGKPKVIDV